MDDFYFLISKDIKSKMGLIKVSNKIEDKILAKNNKINNNQKIIKKRNPGIDLIRIVTMLIIVYTHILFQGKGINKYSRYKNKIYNIFTFFFWHINAFALISGVIGYKSAKYSNLLYLWLCVVFYSISIRYYYLKSKKSSKLSYLYHDYYPVIYGRHWYFSSYFGMYLFLPAVNKGLQYLNKSEFKLLVMSILGIFVFWYNFNSNKIDKIDVFKINSGFSTIWLLCLYIIGVYIGKFNKIYPGIKRYIISLIYLFIFLLLSIVFNKFRDNSFSNINGNFKAKIIDFIKRLISNNFTYETRVDFNSVIKTLQTILITLFFLQLKYNEYLSKFITFLGPLTFGIYLIHTNVYVINNYLRKIFAEESDNLTANEVIKLLILKSIKLFFGCIIIEYLRHLLFTILKIRNACIYVEKIVFKIVS